MARGPHGGLKGGEMYEPLPELESSQESHFKVLVASPWLSLSISDQPLPPNSHRERAVENSRLQNRSNYRGNSSWEKERHNCL